MSNAERSGSDHAVLPGLYRFEDTCAVYLLVDGDDALAIDYGSGAWRAVAARLGLPAPRHVLLTHHHADQCAGLDGLDLDAAETATAAITFDVHAPVGAASFFDPEAVATYWRDRGTQGVPPSYDVLRRGVRGVRCDLQGFADFWWGHRRLRLLHTPGHGAHALTILADIDGRQVAFCGDAVHAGATIWQPYHLEWDHWTGGGALAAWEGLQRLGNLALDLLCPSHGPVIAGAPRAVIAATADKLLALYHAKGQIAAGQPDRYVTPRDRLACGAHVIRDDLWQCGTNTWILRTPTGRHLVIDAQLCDRDILLATLAELRIARVDAATATHYHYDHSDGLNDLRERFGATLMLHPRVAEVTRAPRRVDCPWNPAAPVIPDVLLPEHGVLHWEGLDLHCASFPGQTWWHSLLMIPHRGERLAFAGDNFQPPSRWNGTGGFCSYNGSRFAEGFAASAQLLLDWQPDLLLNGHGTFARFHPDHCRAIQTWSRTAAAAVLALCPRDDLRQDYYLHPH